MLSTWNIRFDAPSCSNLAATLKLKPGMDEAAIDSIVVNGTDLVSIDESTYEITHTFSSKNLYGNYAIFVQIYDASN